MYRPIQTNSFQVNSWQAADLWRVIYLYANGTILADGSYLANGATYYTDGFTLEPRLSIDLDKQEIFISAGSGSSFILTEFGLGKVSADVRAVGNIDSTTLMHSPSVINQGASECWSDSLDFKSVGIKDIQAINFMLQCTEGSIYASVKYRTSRQASFSQTAWKLLNNEGSVNFNIRGIEFMLGFKTSTNIETIMKEASIAVQFVDKRFRRGVQSNSMVGGE